MAGSPARPCGAPAPGPDGVLVVDKPEGPTSHDVVARARRVLGTRQVGHTGTLDPMATGVLALVVGRATRLAQFLSGREKQYLSRIRLGVATDSWDRTGAIVSEMSPGSDLPDAAAVADALRHHLGQQEQVPPAFSAKKLDGVRSYALARRGEAADLAPVVVSLHAATVEAFEPPFVDVRLTCSSGFYVRALANSLGRTLGCGACLETLRRTASGSFTLDAAVTLAEFEQVPEGAALLVPLERALPDMPSVTLTEAGAERVRHGNDVGPGDWTSGGVPSAECRVPPGDEPGTLNSAPGTAYVQLLSPGGRLLAVGRPAGAGFLHPAVVLG
jgi:tRNA pseudouridine55 synthase